MRYVLVTHENYLRKISHGQTLIIDDKLYKVVEDANYRGGYRVGGRSILNVLDECDEVTALGRPE